MKTEELAKLKELAEKAQVIHDDEEIWYWVDSLGIKNLCSQDREFIAACSPERILALIAAIEAAEQRGRMEMANRVANRWPNKADLEDCCEQLGEDEWPEPETMFWAAVEYVKVRLFGKGIEAEIAKEGK